MIGCVTGCMIACVDRFRDGYVIIGCGDWVCDKAC